MAYQHDGTVSNEYGLAAFFQLLIRNFLSLMILNVIFLVCCIPVITIPASITALNRALWMLASDENQGIYKRFFKTYRTEILRAIPLGLFFSVCQAGTLYGIWYYYNAFNSEFITLIPMFICLFLFILLYYAQMYAYVMLAVTDIPTMKILKNSFLLILMVPGRTFGWGTLSLAVAVSGAWFFPYSLPILMLILFALVQFINVFCAAKNMNIYILV